MTARDVAVRPDPTPGHTRLVMGFGLGWMTYAGGTYPNPAESEWSALVGHFKRQSPPVNGSSI